MALAKGIFKMINIQDSELNQLVFDHDNSHSAFKRIAQHPILDLAFRSYFLLAVSCSIVALSVWLAFLNGYFSFSNNGLSAVIWHIHELLFGFAATVAVGFILTAAQTWTRQPSLKGLPLLTFILIWLTVRVFLLINQPVFIYSAMVLQTLWWLGLIAIFSNLVLKSTNRRNYIFIPILSILMLLNLGLLLLDIQGYSELARHMARTAVLIFCLLMGIVGGRVIPFFTVSATNIKKITTPRWLTPLLILVSLAGTLVYFITGFYQASFSPAYLMISAGLLHFFRMSFWQTKATFFLPLLWSLHLAYFSLALGMVLLGTSYMQGEDSLSVISFADALHLITIAAMGLMIFAMMSRVSLGHTGRKLSVNKLIPWCFGLIFVSALARVTLPLFEQTLLAWNISAICWLFASALFLWVYLPVLSTRKLESSF